MSLSSSSSLSLSFAGDGSLFSLFGDGLPLAGECGLATPSLFPLFSFACQSLFSSFITPSNAPSDRISLLFPSLFPLFATPTPGF